MKKRVAIITSYFEGETYGMLGPQMAATIIEKNTPYECIVVAVSREDDKTLIKKALADYFGKERSIIAFSTLSGREDLFSFAKELKKEGAITLLAGPQSDVDFLGETGWEDHPHRFPGLSKAFDFALHGPAEQSIVLLRDLETGEWHETPGLFFIGEGGDVISNTGKSWDERYLMSVRWDNIYRPGGNGLLPLAVTSVQVLQQIGCPHAAKGEMVEIDYPASLKEREGLKIEVPLKGCSFCDVAMDKGYYGKLSMAAVLNQIRSLPEDADGRKIPFELINENPLPELSRLLVETRRGNTRLSQINLILRADWLLRGEKSLRESLRIARDMGIVILAASVGFEAFDDSLLRNFNKGINVETNLKAVRLMRRLKEDFRDVWAYSKTEGAVHGFIHPTPWDTARTFAETQKNIAIYGLSRDILPVNSTPLIIHHASALGDWIREIETRENILYRRYGSIIGWWHEGVEDDIQ